MQLTKGANCALNATRFIIEVSGGAPLDVSALLCAESGKVRSDDDFVFYGAPSGPGVRHRAASGGQPDGVEFDLPAVPADVAKVVVTASLDGSGPKTFSMVPAFTVVARDATSGAVLAEFHPDGLANETALLCAEVYRRNGAWKLRAIGQGFNSGLAGIAITYGVDIADDEPDQAPPPAPPNAAPAPQPTGSVSTPNLTKLTLQKSTVSLAKRQTVSLVKDSGPALRKVQVGLGWDPARQGRNIDLDASCVLLDAGLKKVDTCWFMSTTAAGGAIRHSGDNLTGQGDGDDEIIFVDLEAVPRNVEWLVFTVNSFGKQKFTEVANAYCRLVDSTTGSELVRYSLSQSEPRTGVLMAVLHRAGSDWDMTALGEFADGRTVRAMVKPAVTAIQALRRG
ncbi:MAG: TerD family protein [Microthrixaceae bacterium]|nr:TerD family protein [Microthrixaceae bacterium]MCO5319711.1 TerD family protein [Microthrixaceae bacterium]